MARRMNILVLAYVFPPDAGSGTYRTLYFANHWARSGDAVTVVTVREQDFQADALVDRALLGRIDPAIAVVRAKATRPLQAMLALRNRLSRRSGHPLADGSIRGSPIENSARANKPLEGPSVTRATTTAAARPSL